MSFTEKDIKQIESKGLTIEKVMNQMNLFKTGIPFANLVSAATIGDGIIRLDDETIERYIMFGIFNSIIHNITINITMLHSLIF